MPVVYCLLGLLGFLLAVVLLVLFVPVYARIAYDGQLQVRVRVLGIPITLLPRPEKPAAERAAKPRKKSRKPKEKQSLSKVRELVQMFREDGPAATLHYLCELARLAGKAVGRVLRAITVDKLQLELLVVTGDPADTAVRYGQVCSVLYPALAAISGPVRIRRQQLRVEPNFLLEESDVRLDIRLHVAVYRLVAALLALLVRFILIKETDDNKEVIQHGK